MPLKIDVYAKSISGSAHDYQDRILVDETQQLYAIADGATTSLQGRGSVAAEMAIKLLEENFRNNPADLTSVVQTVHRKMMELRKVDTTIGETTLTAANICRKELRVASVGNSPAYLIREKIVRKLAGYSYNKFVDVIGYPAEVYVQGEKDILQINDYLLLASDGIKHALNEKRILQLIEKQYSAQQIVEELIQNKKTSVYNDDKSLIVLKILSL
jgi:serine/threonine protein phosphatase PrpC